MYRHRRMYNDVYGPYPSLPCHRPRVNIHSPYEILDPLVNPVVSSFAPPCYYDYAYRRNVPCIEYSSCDCIPRRPIVQTNVHNDVSYYLDDPCDQYHDEYGNTYRLSRSKVQLVNLIPKRQPRRMSNRMVVSTFQPTERAAPERTVIPRSTVVRSIVNPSYERPRRMRLMPLYRSTEPEYTVPKRRLSVAREAIPIATVVGFNPPRQRIKVRSLSPM